MNKFTRRGFLQLSGLGLITPYILMGSGSSAYSGVDSSWFRFDAVRSSVEVFGLSVASGDPTPAGVILWTRINPSAWTAGSNLAFEVALDPEFSQVIVQGLVEADEIKAERDYTIKVDLDGQLGPDRYYYYRFIYQNTASRTGRCRTLPLATASVDRIKLAVLTCQDYTNGYYGALSHLSQETDVDFVVHLGDFIYETASAASPEFPDRQIVFPGGNPVAFGIGDYRHLYRTYRSDPFLQRAMEQHTWIIIWDDHETANDSYWDYQRNTLGGHLKSRKNYKFGRKIGNSIMRKLELATTSLWHSPNIRCHAKRIAPI